MSLSGALRRLAGLVDAIEDEGVVVTDADLETDDGAPVGVIRVALDDGTATVTGSDSVTERSGTTSPAEGAGDGASPATTEQTDPASNGVSAEDAGESAATSAPVAQTEGTVTATDGSMVGTTDSADEAGTDDGGGPPTTDFACEVADCDAAFDSETGLKIHRTKVHRSAEETPAYKDPDRLREAYEACESFPAMRDHLGVEVSAQTVRRYAIQHGIYDPDVGRVEAEAQGASAPSDDGSVAEGEPAPSDDGSGGTDGGPETAVAEPATRTADDDTGETPADGAALGVEDVRRAVEASQTPLEVARELGVDRTEATRLLRELDLLDLVMGRAAAADDREERKAELDDRLDGVSGTGLRSD